MVVNIIVNYSCMRVLCKRTCYKKKLKLSKHSFLDRFLSLMAFLLGGREAGRLGPPGYAYDQIHLYISKLNKITLKHIFWMTIINNSITPQFVTYPRSHFPNQKMLNSNCWILKGAGCSTRIPKGLFVAFPAAACAFVST